MTEKIAGEVGQLVGVKIDYTCSLAELVNSQLLKMNLPFGEKKFLAGVRIKKAQEIQSRKVGLVEWASCDPSDFNPPIGFELADMVELMYWIVAVRPLEQPCSIYSLYAPHTKTILDSSWVFYPHYAHLGPDWEREFGGDKIWSFGCGSMPPPSQHPVYVVVACK